jgi:nucleotide-binding universal stress UspA family protein
MNVAQWLNVIDLGQYEALFREHEIAANVLPDLVEADLEKIGVPLGHRKRLMRAIDALSAGGTQRGSSTRRGRKMATKLMAEAERCKADRIVMGGYGHLALRERLLGGMTYELMHDAPVPLLMAH